MDRICSPLRGALFGAALDRSCGSGDMSPQLPQMHRPRSRLRRRRAVRCAVLLAAHVLAAASLGVVPFSDGGDLGVLLRGRAATTSSSRDMYVVEEVIEVDEVIGPRSLAIDDGMLLPPPGWEEEEGNDAHDVGSVGGWTGQDDDGAAAGRRRQHRALIDLTPAHLERYPFTNLADVSSGPSSSSSAPRPTGFYWQIPRSGGTTLKHILGTCLDRVQASRVSRDHCDTTAAASALEVCHTRFGRFVNADPSDDPGIVRASDMGLVESGMADVVVSSRFLHAATLFGGGPYAPPGRAFTVLRHPVERAASTFYYLRDATWERTYSPEFRAMTLVEYAGRADTPHDWMVRWLTGKGRGALSRSDLDFAKLVLRRKFFVMLTDDMPAYVDRLVRYMGWEGEVTPGMRRCAREASGRDAGKNGHEHGRVLPGTEEYEALRGINELDVELYDYAVNELVHEQWAYLYRGTGVTLEGRGGGVEKGGDGDGEEEGGGDDDDDDDEEARGHGADAAAAAPKNLRTPERTAYPERFAGAFGGGYGGGKGGGGGEDDPESGRGEGTVARNEEPARASDVADGSGGGGDRGGAAGGGGGGGDIERSGGPPPAAAPPPPPPPRMTPEQEAYLSKFA